MEISLGPLDADEADALLESRGVVEPAQRAAAVSWARGSPLALALAAEVGEAPAATLAEGGPGAMVDRLLSWLLDAQPEGEHRNVLAVAALARVTTRDLLATVLPGIDAGRAFGWLARHPSAEPLRDGVMLHDLVGHVLRADLRRRAPDLERDLRRRIADALYADSARGGLLRMTLDLQHLVQDPAIRWGFAWDMSGRYWVDPPRPDDLTAITRLGGRAARAWLEGAEPYFRHAPELVTIVRDRGGGIAGYGVSLTPATAPAWAADDPVVGPRVAHAARHVPGGAAVICRQAVDFTRQPSSPVTALIGMAAIIGSGLDNPAAAYLPISRTDAAAKAFSAACGARPVAELAIEHGGVRVEGEGLGDGPGGLRAFEGGAGYRELVLAPPAVPVRPPVEVVRTALRAYGSRAGLAASPLAPPGGSASARAEQVRRRIDDAVHDAFGSSREDQRCAALVRGYIDPAPTTRPPR
jgi:hypothetical protein